MSNIIFCIAASIIPIEIMSKGYQVKKTSCQVLFLDCSIVTADINMMDPGHQIVFIKSKDVLKIYWIWDGVFNRLEQWWLRWPSGWIRFRFNDPFKPAIGISTPLLVQNDNSTRSPSHQANPERQEIGKSMQCRINLKGLPTNRQSQAIGFQREDRRKKRNK